MPKAIVKKDWFAPDASLYRKSKAPQTVPALDNYPDFVEVVEEELKQKPKAEPKNKE